MKPFKSGSMIVDRTKPTTNQTESKTENKVENKVEPQQQQQESEKDQQTNQPTQTQELKQVSLDLTDSDSKVIISTTGPKMAIGTASSKGRRKRNEDALVALGNLPEDPETAFLAVYDGHGGKKCSTFCANKLHSFITSSSSYPKDKKTAIYNAFVETDAAYLKKPSEDGSTALAVLINKDLGLIVANAGDSRGVLCSNGKGIPLSKDHKPGDEEEKARIEKAGFLVMKSTEVIKGARHTVYRVNGLLAVSRSIGDSAAKDTEGPPETQPVTCCPDVKEFPAKPGDTVVLACDGVWDILSNDDVAIIVADNLKQQKTVGEVADLIVKAAYDGGSSDNISVIVAQLLESKT